MSEREASLVAVARVAERIVTWAQQPPEGETAGNLLALDALIDELTTAVQAARDAGATNPSKLERDLHNANAYAARLKRERDEARDALAGYGVLLLEESEDTADGVRALAERDETLRRVGHEVLSAYDAEPFDDAGISTELYEAMERLRGQLIVLKPEAE